MRTLASTRPQQLFWLLLSSQCHLSVAWRNGSSSGSRTRSLLFQCDLSPTWGYIRQRCSLCRCSLLCESIPKLAALQPPWPREQFRILRKLFETFILKRETICSMCIHTYVRMHTVRTGKFSIEHTRVELAHARPNYGYYLPPLTFSCLINPSSLLTYWKNLAVGPTRQGTMRVKGSCGGRRDKDNRQSTFKKRKSARAVVALKSRINVVLVRLENLAPRERSGNVPSS